MGRGEMRSLARLQAGGLGGVEKVGVGRGVGREDGKGAQSRASPTPPGFFR